MFRSSLLDYSRKSHHLLTFNHVYPSLPKSSILESLLPLQNQPHIPRLHKPPIRNMPLYPAVIFRARLHHTNFPIRLALTRSLQRTRGIESPDEEEILAEGNHP
jgi:hypothetical protein